ncbi:type II toxin-antitoxin system RatA family toxin [bacterium]|nr:type II toxin-antitoxin system RatA family toxin [bacterium]
MVAVRILRWRAYLATVIERSALVMHSAEQMFDLVNDVAAYPQFVNYCSSSEIIAADEGSMRARLRLQKAGLSVEFVTSNVLQRPSSIVMRLEEGPFSAFAGEWQFTALQEDACKVALNMQFSMNKGGLSMLVAPLFESVADRLVASFCDRAKVVYGG